MIKEETIFNMVPALSEQEKKRFWKMCEFEKVTSKNIKNQMSLQIPKQ
jgi:hypothetical protein